MLKFSKILLIRGVGIWIKNGSEERAVVVKAVKTALVIDVSQKAVNATVISKLILISRFDFLW